MQIKFPDISLKLCLKLLVYTKIREEKLDIFWEETLKNFE